MLNVSDFSDKVLKRDLKVFIGIVCLISAGKEFHRMGVCQKNSLKIRLRVAGYD